MAKEKKVTKFLELLTMEEVTALYKHFSGVTVVKFKDREDAEQRLITASFGKPHPVMVEAFKKVGISKETSNQYGTMLRGPIAFPDGPMSPKDMKKHKAALSVGKRIDQKDEASTEGKQPNAVGASVLRTMRELIPEGAEGEAAQTDSTVVAEKLGTNTNAVIKAAEQLKKLDLVGCEDDTPEGGEAYYELWLTDTGRTFELRTPSASPPVKLPGSHSGPRSGFGGKLIYPLVTGNPRRPGSIGFTSFALIKPGMTFEEYKKAGGRNTDLQWDIAHGFTIVLAAGEAAPKVGSAPVAPPPSAPKAPPAPKAEGKKTSKPDPAKEIEELRAKLAEMEKAHQEKAPPPSAPKKKAAAPKKATKKKGGKKK